MNLIDLRNNLKKEFKFFPTECCRIASERVAKLGYKKTFGLFIDDDGLGNDHHWNKRDGKIYDITASQFSNKLPEILILNENSKEAKARYVEGVYFMT